MKLTLIKNGMSRVGSIIQTLSEFRRCQLHEPLLYIFAGFLLLGSFLILELNYRPIILLVFFAPLAVLGIFRVKELVFSKLLSYHALYQHLCVCLILIACFVIFTLNFWGNDPHIDYFFYAALTNQLASGFGKNSFFLLGEEYDYYYAANLLPGLVSTLLPNISALEINLTFTFFYFAFYLISLTQTTRKYFAELNSVFSILSVCLGMMLSQNIFLSNSIPFFSGQPIQNFAVYFQSLNMLLGSGFFVLILNTILNARSETLIFQRCILLATLAVIKLPLALIASFIIVLHGFLFQWNKNSKLFFLDSCSALFTLLITIFVFHLDSLFSLAASRTVVGNSFIEKIFNTEALLHPILIFFVYLAIRLSQLRLKYLLEKGSNRLLLTLSISSCCIYVASLLGVFSDGGSFIDQFLTPIMSISVTFLISSSLVQLRHSSFSATIFCTILLLLFLSSALFLNWLYFEFSLSVFSYVLVLVFLVLPPLSLLITKFAKNTIVGVILPLLFCYVNPFSFYSALDTRSNFSSLDRVARFDLKNIEEIIGVEVLAANKLVVGISNERCPLDNHLRESNYSCSLQSSLVPSLLGLPSLVSFESYLALNPSIEDKIRRLKAMIDDCYLSNCSKAFEEFSVKNNINVFYYLQDNDAKPLILDGDVLYVGERFDLKRLFIKQTNADT